MVLLGFKPTIVVRWLLLPKYVVLLLLFLLATSIKVAFKNHIKSSELPYPRYVRKAKIHSQVFQTTHAAEGSSK